MYDILASRLAAFALLSLIENQLLDTQRSKTYFQKPDATEKISIFRKNMHFHSMK